MFGSQAVIFMRRKRSIDWFAKVLLPLMWDNRVPVCFVISGHTLVRYNLSRKIFSAETSSFSPLHFRSKDGKCLAVVCREC